MAVDLVFFFSCALWQPLHPPTCTRTRQPHPHLVLRARSSSILEQCDVRELQSNIKHLKFKPRWQLTGLFLLRVVFVWPRGARHPPYMCPHKAFTPHLWTVARGVFWDTLASAWIPSKAWCCWTYSCVSLGLWALADAKWCVNGQEKIHTQQALA